MEKFFLAVSDAVDYFTAKMPNFNSDRRLNSQNRDNGATVARYLATYTQLLTLGNHGLDTRGPSGGDQKWSYIIDFTVHYKIGEYLILKLK